MLTDAYMADLQSASDTSQAADEEGYSIGATKIYEITPADSVCVSVTVDELDIGHIQEGQTCTVAFDALSGKYVGTITGRAVSADNSGGNTKYTVEITVDKTSDMLAGMNASASIPVSDDGEKAEADTETLVIPESALYEENGEVYVYTSYDEKEDMLSQRRAATNG